MRRRSITPGACLGGLVVTAALVLAPQAASAASVTGIGGYDHYQGPLGQRTDGGLAGVAVGVGGGDLFVAGSRFDDTLIGRGYALHGGFGLPVGPAVRLRASASRFDGSGDFRAWRTKVGPEVGPRDGWRVLLSYVHYQDDADASSDGVTAESTLPLSARLDARMGASSATTATGPNSLQGAVGLNWRPWSHLALSGELGLARGASGAGGQPVPGHGGLLDGLLLLGGGGSPPDPGTPPERKVERTLLLGMRVTLP